MAFYVNLSSIGETKVPNFCTVYSIKPVRDMGFCHVEAIDKSWSKHISLCCRGGGGVLISSFGLFKVPYALEITQTLVCIGSRFENQDFHLFQIIPQQKLSSEEGAGKNQGDKLIQPLFRWKLSC